ncbi:AAA family ATPase [Sporolactobacillus laevolacticus]|uniref:AAA family ATPase n=1 Tax=Sporolactobacillus laevolacticus TaxID=33018 RepID=UPI0025B4D1A6|nr:AAA family ATPase [Sporolactobacillus laevolacticus]MDN3955817.1 AAA family ATPase [Sporolactobacillus laevolacticus]
MIERVDLTHYHYVFTEPELSGLKQKNYFYGKNGTGKSSLVRAIKEQYEGEYAIQVFQGFDQLIGQNENLNAISLGEQNTEALALIEKIDQKIEEIKAETEMPEHPDDNHPNLFLQVNAAKAIVNEQQQCLLNFWRKAASAIKNDHLALTGPNYNKNNLCNDIPKAKALSDTEIIDYESTINANPIDMSMIEKVVFPVFGALSKISEATNEVLGTVVKPSKILAEIDDSPEKQNFARLGMQIHQRETGECCAFCGNEISNARWEDLDSYFSDEIKRLEKRINDGKQRMDSLIQRVDVPMRFFDEKQWHRKYQRRASEVFAEGTAQKESILNFLKGLKQQLIYKQSHLFEMVSPSDMTVPSDFTKIQEQYEELFSQNKDFNDNLAKERDSVIQALRGHWVYQKLVDFNYDSKVKALEVDKAEYETKLNILTTKRQELQIQKAERREAVDQTKNEAAAAKAINKLLYGLGDDSFELRHTPGAEKQNGLYKIVDKSGKERSIKTLSTGEKNILAFLYFMYDLRNADSFDARERVVIFDDPMNSNDDNCQYLIIAEIQHLLSDQNHPQFFLLTHNNHFYVQLRPNRPNYTNGGFFHLRHGDKTSILPITKPDQDLKTIYEDLWDELKFAYLNDKIIFMWNNMRRILETYGKFNFGYVSPRNIEAKLDNVEDKVLFLALLKSLHVNSHVGYETDIDLSGRDKEQLLLAFRQVFESLGADSHYVAYWDEDNLITHKHLIAFGVNTDAGMSKAK